MIQNQKKEGKTSLIAAVMLIAIAAAATGTTIVYAQVDISQLTPAQIQQIQAQAEVDPVLELEDEPVNATDDRQAIVRPGDSLSSNGTQVLQMAGADDVDFKGLVPEGITVIITNTTATVTNQPVEPPGVAAGGGNTVPTPASTPPEEAAPAPATEDDNSEEDEE